MEKIIACCGIICSECPAFLATRKDNDNERKRVAEMWADRIIISDKIMPVKWQDINCDGCHADNGRIFIYCRPCEIRKCCQEKNLINCAYCTNYPCEKIEKNTSPESRKVLDDIKKGGEFQWNKT